MAANGTRMHIRNLMVSGGHWAHIYIYIHNDTLHIHYTHPMFIISMSQIVVGVDKGPNVLHACPDTEFYAIIHYTINNLLLLFDFLFLLFSRYFEDPNICGQIEIDQRIEQSVFDADRFVFGVHESGIVRQIAERF